MTFLPFEAVFAAIAFKISSIDSSFALSIKAQVLTMITSASSSLPTSVCPPPTRRESIFSVSTLFLSHPSDIAPIFIPRPRFEPSL